MDSVTMSLCYHTDSIGQWTVLQLMSLFYYTDSIGHGSFRSKRNKQQESPSDHPKVTVEALKETPPLRKRVNLRPIRARLRPLVHFDHQSIPIVIGTLPANINQFGMYEHIGEDHMITVIF